MIRKLIASKIKGLLLSRKFWAMIVSTVALKWGIPEELLTNGWEAIAAVIAQVIPLLVWIKAQGAVDAAESAPSFSGPQILDASTLSGKN